MIPVTLEFAKAGKVEVQFMVGPANATSMEHTDEFPSFAHRAVGGHRRSVALSGIHIRQYPFR